MESMSLLSFKLIARLASKASIFYGITNKRIRLYFGIKSAHISSMHACMGNKIIVSLTLFPA